MTKFFNAFHAPIGAHSSFTLGHKGQSGGLGLELSGPAEENVYIGVEEPEGGTYAALPFFGGVEDDTARYFENEYGDDEEANQPLVREFSDDEISRGYRLGVDKWTAGDLTFSIFSPVESVPDPADGDDATLKRLLCPAVLAELTIDNRSGSKARRAFFGYGPQANTDAVRVVDSQNDTSTPQGAGFVGVAKGQSTGIFASDMTPITHFTIERALDEKWPDNCSMGLGGVGLLVGRVAPGELKTFRFALCFFRQGIVTTGIRTRYLYNRWFDNLETVGDYALNSFDAMRESAVAADTLLDKPHLTEDQRFQMIHSIRSYYGSTQLLEYDGEPLWVVNEGEYRMMNTFDLTVDQLFFEMRMNPWTVRNELDLFTSRYSYTDKVHFPDGDNDHPGGISFTHDMGQRNHFSRPGYSSYELSALDGCFSYMTHEQLVNWVLCAGIYVKQTGDKRWLEENLSIFEKCLTSMLNRDNPVASDRNGVMGLDSSRTEKGSEITTYDSLDESLGQARNNLYMAVKGWASYLMLADVFEQSGIERESAIAGGQARRAADTIVSFVADDGSIPAVMGEESQSVIIPAIEGLVFPHLMGYEEALSDNGPYGELIKALHQHFKVILKRDVCLYPNGAWKLSSTADNSWLSKIYLCQFVAREILGERSAETMATADAAHVQWLLDDRNIFFAWSDQIKGGVAKGSKYYPRGVTSILWLEESS